MTSIQAKIASGVATAALLTASFVPAAFADTSVFVGGNGSYSRNNVDISNRNSTNLTQRNSSTILNDVSVSNNTGNNRANDNTGGDVSIRTGDAASSVDIFNGGNKNIANLNGCNCDNNNSTDVDVSGNGYRSHNDVSVDNNNSTRVSQQNNSFVNNDVNVHNNTGNNTASGNTGSSFSPFFNHFNNNLNNHLRYMKDGKWMGYGDNGWNWNDYNSWFGGNGGNVSISTGDALSHVGLTNLGGTNIFSN